MNTYAGELALPYVSAALLGSETIAKNRCRFIEGIVGKTVVSGLTSTDTIQASSCNWADGSNLALTEQVLDPSDLKVNEEICRGTMYPTWIASNGRMERNGQLPATWSDFLLGAVAERTGTNLETLLWQSDTGAIFGTGFLSNDGVIDEAGINASATQGFAQQAQTSSLTWVVYLLRLKTHRASSRKLDADSTCHMRLMLYSYKRWLHKILVLVSTSLWKVLTT